jgi:hypothetical protein
MYAAKKSFMFAGKLIALNDRKVVAMRDIFDIYFFGQNNWEIDEDIIIKRTGKPFKNYLSDCIKTVEGLADNQILHGIGELIDEKQKDWIRNNLKKETIFILKKYQNAISS